MKLFYKSGEKKVKYGSGAEQRFGQSILNSENFEYGYAEY